MPDRTGDVEIGRRIQAARRRAGFTQQQLVDRLPSATEERTHRWLSNIETGVRGASPRDVAEIATACGTTTDEILLGRTPEPVGDEGLLVLAYRTGTRAERRMLLASARAIAEEHGVYHLGGEGMDDTPQAAAD